MVNAIHGQLDGMSGDAKSMSEISNEQTGIMTHLGQTIEGLAGNFEGMAAKTFIELGEKMKNNGMQRAAQFEDHSQKMNNNVNLLQGKDEENASIIQQVDQLI